MMEYLTADELERFRLWLIGEEKSRATVDKYRRDVRVFFEFLDGRALTKEEVIAYKQRLQESGYAVRSINSVLAALNSLFAFLGRYDCKVRTIRTQRRVYCSEDRELSYEEYARLVETARRQKNDRLELILQTICGTGIRVSELTAVTVEAARRGEASVCCKGKTRTVFLVRELKCKLLRYAKEKGIETGAIFLTRTGRPVGRIAIWREMKQLCRDAHVNPSKVYPHNLRHLFARMYYKKEKDIAGLADILGHSSINTTRIYTISTGKEHRARMEKMHLIL